MPTTYLPAREPELVDFARNFDTLITATPGAFGLDAGQALTFNGLWSTFWGAYQAAVDPITRTPGMIQAKRDAKRAMISGDGGIRELVNIIQSFPGTTNQMRADLRITVADVEPTPVPIPILAPEIDLLPPVVRRVRVRLHNKKTLGRGGKPDGVDGALVFSYVGPNPPAAEDTNLWNFEVNTKKTSFEIEFPSTVPAGSTVWITAFWYNPRGDSGPSTPAVYTLLPGSLSMAA